MKKTSYKNFFFSFILFLFSLGTAAIAIFLNWIAYNIGAENYFFSVFFAICGIFLLSIAGLLGYAIKNPETLSEADTDDSSLVFLVLFNIICAIGSINITKQHSPFLFLIPLCCAKLFINSKAFSLCFASLSLIFKAFKSR